MSYRFTSSLILLGFIASCRSSGTSDEIDQIMHGSITYPFAAPTEPLGKNKSEKFVIRSTVGNTEYQVEIPHEADDYDIQVPLADISGGRNGLAEVGTTNVGDPKSTDREMLAQLPKLGGNPGDSSVLDKAFGVGPKGGPDQGPSYTLGLAKIQGHYRRKDYEFALIDINNLLTYYPNSVKLFQMKGTVLVKLKQDKLALRAWQRALELSPSDKRLLRGVRYLENKLLTENTP